MSNKYPVICLERVIGYYSKGLYIVSENLMLTDLIVYIIDL